MAEQVQESKPNVIADKVAIKPIQAVQKPTMKSAETPQNTTLQAKPKAWPGKV